jgi:hypothetical protein
MSLTTPARRAEMGPAAMFKLYWRNCQAMRNGTYLEWPEPIMCECVRVKYRGG